MGQTGPAVDFLFGYAGRPWDAETGLYDNRARWYDPAVGRLLSEDRYGFAGGQDLNLYRYVGNNPWNNTDPSGLCKVDPDPTGTAVAQWLGSTLGQLLQRPLGQRDERGERGCQRV